jgi:ABC-type branched-subunit amino acid transport system ATPase component/ABC-type branched-subunit amino acid transport system permease subunit
VSAASEVTSEARGSSAPRRRSRLRFIGADTLPVVVLAAALLIPRVTDDLLVISLVPTIVIAILGTLHVWLMLRVNLLSFASPPFMALGGYALALAAKHTTVNPLILVPLAFLVPSALALALGALVLRLRGTYFALITFALAQVAVLAIGMNDSILGGMSGLSGIPPVKLAGHEFAAGAALLDFTVVVGIVGVVVAVAVSRSQRRNFAAINENEVLAATLGLRPWLYKTIAFVCSAGLAGLAGMLLVNQLGNAQPETFSPFSSTGHVAGAVVGGTGSVLGAVLGAGLFAWMTNEFASQAEYAHLLLGLTLIAVVLFAKNGISDVLLRGTGYAVGRLRKNVGPAADSRPAQRLDGRAATETRPAPVSPAHPTGAQAAVADRTPLLEVRGLSRRFGGLRAVDNLTFSLSDGEVLGVIGPNGAGKTTLISMLAGAVAPSSGQILLNGKRIDGKPSHAIARRGVARTFQQTAIFPSETVHENLERALSFSGHSDMPEEVAKLVESTGLALRLNDKSGDLPYGFQKVLGLIMGLATRPRLLLLDEPAAGLEVSERWQIDDIVRIAVDSGCAVILVEHDMDLVRRICPRVIVMDSGRHLAEGSPDEVFKDAQVISAYLGTASEDLEAAPADRDRPAVES